MTAATPSPVVLLVDDELLIRWSLREGLTEAGYTVREAEDAAAAREQFNGDVAAAILDIRLPDADGLDLLEELQRSRPELAVVMISAHATRRTEEEARRRGAHALAPKPFDVDAVVRLVGEAIASRARHEDGTSPPTGSPAQ